MQREAVGEVDLPDAVFAAPCEDHLLHLVVRAQLADRRQGTHAAKTRSFVAGGGKKPWRQKGSGRARQGSTRAPHWRGGGVTFGPHPRKHYVGVNKRVRRAALCGALSRRAVDNTVVVVDAFAFEAQKTKHFVSFMKRFDLSKVLVVTAAADNQLNLVCRNVPDVTLMPVAGLNVYDVLKHTHLVLTRDAVAAIAARLSNTEVEHAVSA
jgi:large subunit ribosomal protein L4